MFLNVAYSKEQRSGLTKSRVCCIKFRFEFRLRLGVVVLREWSPLGGELFIYPSKTEHSVSVSLEWGHVKCEIQTELHIHGP